MADVRSQNNLAPILYLVFSFPFEGLSTICPPSRRLLFKNSTSSVNSVKGEQKMFYIDFLTTNKICSYHYRLGKDMGKSSVPWWEMESLTIKGAKDVSRIKHNHLHDPHKSIDKTQEKDADFTD
jgi:hypothetical protein